MIHVFYIWLVLVALFIGYFVGAVTWSERTVKTIGYMKFNTKDPTKEFLELHITDDIDPTNPPKHVKFDIQVPGGKTNGS